jgi:hypothetical protein
MQAYQISERGFHVGPGALLLISAAQLADRMHRVEIVEKPKKDASFVLIKTKDVQQFRAGDLLGLLDLPKGMGHMAELVKPKKKDDPETVLVKACADFSAAAEEAELQRQIAAEEAEKKRAAEQTAAAEKAQVADWIAEWQNNDAIKAKYPTSAEYVAVRRAETAKA